MNLNFDIASCVRAKSKFSSCTKCVDICPTQTMVLSNNIPAFTPTQCIECGGCVGVCPTEAFSMKNFSPTEFFFKTIEEQKHELSCQKDLNFCLSILNIEYLLSLALSSSKNIIIDAYACNCGGESKKLREQLISNIDEVNFILESISPDKQIEIKSLSTKKETTREKESKTTDRRSFLSLKGAIKSKQEFDKIVISDELKEFGIDISSISNIREKRIPDKRKLLYIIVKEQRKPESYDILAQEDISFISQKYIDSNCTNCQMCYRVCPTGALSSDHKFSVINFDSMMCIKCNLCHDVCEINSIHIQKGFEIKEFFEPKKRLLASFDIKRCNECGNYFTYRGGEIECPRCKIEEEEAIALHNFSKK